MAEGSRGFLGLTHNPFVGNQPGFFEKAERKARLDQLRHLSQWSRRIMLITGEMGSGKTTLCRELYGNLDARVSAAQLNGTLVSAGREVLFSTAVSFGIEPEVDAVSAELIETIADHVAFQEEDGRFCIAMIDDAHLLDRDAIDSLMYLASVSQLRVILFGEEQLLEATSRSTESAHTQEIRLLPLRSSEIRDYIEWRFAQAKYRGRSPLTDEQIREIGKVSGGLPGRINELVNDQLILLELGSSAKDRGRFPDMHRGLITLIIIVTGLVYLIVRPDFGERPDEQVEPVAQPDAGNGSRADLLVLVDELDPNPAEQPSVENLNQVDPTVDAGGLAVEISASDPSQDVGQAAGQDSIPDTATEVSSVQSAIPVTTQADDSPETASPVSEVAVAEPQFSPNPVEAIDSTTEAAISDVRDDTWLLQQDPDLYTLQLMTLSTRERADEFIARQKEPRDFATYELKKTDRTLIVVVYGLFSTSGAADDAVANLPREIGRIEPWKRRVGQIQITIRGN
jgi:DamX protein